MIPARPPSILYQLGVGLVAIAMILLPLIYVGLTAFLAWEVYQYATHGMAAFWKAWPGNSFMKVVVVVTPLIVGVIVVLFMIKPLFARRAAHMQPLALNPEFDPRVYALVNEICRLLGAPAPKRIELDCTVNASASFDRGLRGAFANSLILTLGLPLVASLSTRELAGVVAHEFGHFRQGTGMRVTYLIRRVNGWFHRVIYERDQWDEAVASWSAGAEGWMVLVVVCVNCGIWLSRAILWTLMMLGHAICAFLLRQMEYDADEADIRLAGSHAFESTTHKLALLGLVNRDIHLEMRRSWRSNFRLPDNLPLLIAHRAEKMPLDRQERIANEIGFVRTGLLDTHPSAADRIARARRLAEPGYDISGEPARDLFENFEAVSHMVTLTYYEDDLEVPTGEDFLIPVRKMMGETP